MPLKLPSPLRDGCVLAIRAAPNQGLVVYMLLFQVPLQFVRKLELGVAESTLERRLSLEDIGRAATSIGNTDFLSVTDFFAQKGGKLDVFR